MDEDHFRILLIEDDEDDYSLVKTLLSQVRSVIYHLDWASNYEQGLSSLCGTGYDACLLDYLLGARNGLELLREAIKRGCDIPIILLTGQGNEGVDLEAMRAGAADYLVKGLISKELLERSIRFSITHRRTEASLRGKTAELALANEALRLDDLRLQALLELSQKSAATMKEIGDFVVEQQVKLTRSKVGWIGFTNEAGTFFRVSSCSMSKLHNCEDMPLDYPLEKAGLWTEIINRREPIISNENKQESVEVCPNDRQQLYRYMSVPILDGDRVAGIGLVGNKEEDYDQSDVRQLTLLMDGIWKLIQREKALKRLRESESLAAMGRALSCVAHDIKTPLIAIGGFTSIVHKHLDPANPDREKLGIVLKETERLEAMVKDMLDFSKPLKLQKTREDISRILTETVEVVAKIAEQRNVNFKANLSHHIDPVSVDVARFKQVLINLLVNAVQASPSGQTVTIETHSRGRDLAIDVIDCGCGISLDQRPEIFSPFFTTKKEGTGLGLPIVQKIIDAHNGSVEVLDNPEGGVTFRVVLPIAA